MAFEVIVYFTPRLSEAVWRTLFAPDTAASTAASGNAALVALAQWPTRPFRRAWTPQQSWTRPPGDASAAGIAATEVLPFWRAQTFQPLGVVVAFGSSADGDLPIVAEPALGSIPARRSYQTWTTPRLIGTAAFDDFIEPGVLDDAVGSIVRNLYRKDYTAYIRMGREPGDATHDPDTYVRIVGRPAYRSPYSVKAALEFCFNLANDDSFAAGTQPEQQSAIVRNVYRTRYNAQPALAYAFNHPPLDASVVIAAQPEAVGTIVRNPYHTAYNSRAAAAMFVSNTPGDDSTAPVLLTGGVYVPTLRRRRR